jgi:P-type Cu+ transporter
MAKDPICNMDVDEAKAQSSSTHGGKTYYFCCEGCKKEFDANPEKYASNA